MVVPALDVPDEKVRKLAVRIVVDVYKQGGRSSVEKHLHVSSDFVDIIFCSLHACNLNLMTFYVCQNCKPALQNLLQQRFDEADGKAPSASKGGLGSSNRLTPLNRPAAGMSSLPPLRMDGVAIKGRDSASSSKETGETPSKEFSHPFGAVEMPLPMSSGPISGASPELFQGSMVMEDEEEQLMSSILQDV